MLEKTKAIFYSQIRLEIEQADAVEAGKLYGNLLGLEHQSDEFYSINSAEFEINHYDDDGDRYSAPWSYWVRMNIEFIPENKMRRLLAVLLEPEPEEASDAKQPAKEEAK